MNSFVFIRLWVWEALSLSLLSSKVVFLTVNLVILSVVCKEKICSKSNIVFTDQGILLYYFIHIIFYKLLLRYIFLYDTT